jgi:tetratricopeptide (TPR) repeat protein
MRYFLFIILISCQTGVWSQASNKYESPLAGFYRAEDLYAKQQFSAARKEFRLFIDEYKGAKSDPFVVKALYYEGRSALELFNNDAISLLESFILEYPESIYRDDIMLQIGRYYYQKKDYKNAILAFNKLNRGSVEKDNQSEYFFKLGYSYFEREQAFFL